MNIIQKSTDYFKNNWVVEANGSKIIAIVMLSVYVFGKAAVKIVEIMVNYYPETIKDGNNYLHNLIEIPNKDIQIGLILFVILLVILWVDSFFTIENINRRRSISCIEDGGNEYLNDLFRKIKINRMQQITWHFKIVGSLCIFLFLIYTFDNDYYAFFLGNLFGILVLGMCPLMLYSNIYSAYWKYRGYSESKNVSLSKYASLKPIITSAILVPSLIPIIHILDKLPKISNNTVYRMISAAFFIGFLVIWFRFLLYIISWVFMKFDKPMEIRGDTVDNTHSDKYNFINSIDGDVIALQLQKQFFDVEDIFFNDGSKPTEIKIENAIRFYAQDVEKKDVIFCIDETVFESCENGCLVTNKSIYVHNHSESINKILWRNVESMQIINNSYFRNTIEIRTFRGSYVNLKITCNTVCLYQILETIKDILTQTSHVSI